MTQIATVRTNTSLKWNVRYSGLYVLHYFNIIKMDWWHRIECKVKAMKSE